MSTQDLLAPVHDKIWAAVDAYTQKHTHPTTAGHHEILSSALQRSRDEGLPNIATPPSEAKLYALQCRAKGVRHALEVGTLGGYTTLWLATINPSLKVTTVEVSERHAEVARANITAAGPDVADRVDIRVGNALDILPQLAAEIARGDLPPLGFVYVDADKVNNWTYLDLAINMCEPGAVLYVDNIVRKGAVADFTNEDPRLLGARQVIEMAGKDERVDCVVLQVVGKKGYDGMLMAVVR